MEPPQLHGRFHKRFCNSCVQKCNPTIVRAHYFYTGNC